MCVGPTPEGTMYDAYYIRLLGVYYVTRLRCIQHYQQQIERVEPIVLMLGQRRRRWANIKTTSFSVRVNMSIKSTVVSVESLLLALPSGAYINTYNMDYSCRPTHQTQRFLNNLG